LPGGLTAMRRPAFNDNGILSIIAVEIRYCNAFMM
jgi:hypothetical protein